MTFKNLYKLNTKITLYKNVNEIIHYISLKNQSDNTIVIIWGELEKDAEYEFHQFIDRNEITQFLKSKIEETLLTYNYKPRFKSVKIGMDLSDYGEEVMINIWIPFTQFLESQLFISGNGFITDDYYDEIKKKDIRAFSSENNHYCANFSVINLNNTMTMIEKYLKENEATPITIKLLEVD